MPAIEATDQGCRIHIHAAPRASKSRVVGLHDDRIKIQIAAPPVDGAANAELLKFLAGVLNVPRSQLSLVAGESGKRKTVSVTGVTCDHASLLLGL